MDQTAQAGWKNPEKMQLHLIASTAKTAKAAEPARPGLFLVKPIGAPHGGPALVPPLASPSRPLGMLVLAATAVASPLLWLLHAVLVSGR